MAASSLLRRPATQEVKDGIVAALKEAKRLISRPGGWTQGQYTSRKNFFWGLFYPSFCLIGGVSEAAGTDGNVRFAALTLIHEAIVKLKNGPMGIAEFNDAPATTKDDVLDVLEGAIVMAEAIEVGA